MGGSFMKKSISVLMIILTVLIITTTGCTNYKDNTVDETAKQSGLIFMIEDNRVLVVDGIENVNIPWNSWFENGKRAIMFGVTEDTEIELNGEAVTVERLKRGQAVEVWYSGPLAESYPEQGSADRIVIINETSAGDFRTDSGRFSGMAADEEELLISIRISGVPEEIPPRVFRLTDEAGILLDQLDLQEGSEILFRYLEDETSDGLIFDLSLLGS
jgi:hypothetical protein